MRIFQKDWKTNFKKKFQNLFWAEATALTFQDAYVEADNAHLGENPAIA